ncbi:endonuclease/exonuclease/phosphatase family protein [Ilumatobacter nonamiensis]|uniref:endonuclease/exonuclease/phosphatase family protein n=1 Tax=Ilumatobacter nonamiensis TaxID=467093 RepID=UPI0003482EEB|nr:endonuclease/exonuclease/phosphatase family protein [Ilumatobacter nonamiensis]
MANSRRDPGAQPVLHRGSHVDALGDPTGELCVVSWNIQFGVEVEAAAEALGTAEPLRAADLILLQEMDEEGTERIARQIGADYVFASLGPHRQTGRSFGNAVLSRWPLSREDAFVLPHRSAVQGQERLVVGAVASVGSSSVAVWSVHAEVPTLSPPKRRRQFDAIARVDQRRADLPMVAGGDFNTMTRRGVAAVDAAMATAGATRVSVGADPTLRRGGREFALDHIYARDLTPIDRGVVHGIAASDHRPLWVRLEL